MVCVRKPIIRIIFASFFVSAESIMELYSWVVGKGLFCACDSFSVDSFDLLDYGSFFVDLFFCHVLELVCVCFF